MNSTIALLEALWLEIRTHLEKEKTQIYEEIENYPPPIPACDLQYNHLLEERTRVTQELNRVREASEQGSNYADSVRLIREFLGSCAYIDDALEARLKSDLAMAQSEREKSA